MQPDRGRKLLKTPVFSQITTEMLVNLAFFAGTTPTFFVQTTPIDLLEHTLRR